MAHSPWLARANAVRVERRKTWQRRRTSSPHREGWDGKETRGSVTDARSPISADRPL